ncbi:hypothetical protein [Prescottella equi]|uniref:hypothetical protein n=1 Tax=Rhodococcus hoagii TaxID=43767 RepID=UPI0007CD62EC|nr:hypothetical protein [Prescottella equi]
MSDNPAPGEEASPPAADMVAHVGSLFPMLPDGAYWESLSTFFQFQSLSMSVEARIEEFRTFAEDLVLFTGRRELGYGAARLGTAPALTHGGGVWGVRARVITPTPDADTEIHCGYYFPDNNTVWYPFSDYVNGEFGVRKLIIPAGSLTGEADLGGSHVPYGACLLARVMAVGENPGNGLAVTFIGRR